jgi:hypothetical protein
VAGTIGVATKINALSIATVAIDADCVGDRWAVENADRLARIVAIIAMGQATHAANIIQQLAGWLNWTMEWLAADMEARGLILEDIASSMLAATGRKKTDLLTGDALNEVLAGVIAWIAGKTIREIEDILGGCPDTGSATAKHCPRSRELVGTVIPRGMSFILGLVSHVVRQIDPFDKQEDLNAELIELLSTAVRRGFDTSMKLQFALNDKKLIGRVQAHKAWAAQISFFAVSLGDS